MSDALQILFGEYEVKPLRVGQIPAFLRATRGLLGDAMRVKPADLVAVHGDALIEAMSIAVGKSRADIEAMLPDEFVGLVAAVVEVNADFFVQRLRPAIEASTERIVAILGPTPLAGSSEAATG